MPSLQRTPRFRYAIAALVALCVAVPVALAQEPAEIVGSDGPDLLAGTAGDDAIYGRGGNDTLNGLAGNDELDGGTGGDLLAGGTGKDSVGYDGLIGVTVTIDGAADDGRPGEGDNVTLDVEDLFGTGADDTLTGSAADNTIDGGAGRDIIDGAGGLDTIYGDLGDDIITATDGRVDRIECGLGQDTAVIDTGDTTAGCEKVVLPATTPPFQLSGKRTSTRSRIRSIGVIGVIRRSRIVVACRSDCRPAWPPSRAIARRSARPTNGIATISLPRRPRIAGGTMFEVGVTAPRGARGRCVVFRVLPRISDLRAVRSRSCISAARTRR